MEKVILVDRNNNQIGTEEKLKAHQDAKLHRAFSIYIFNNKGELLIQQRAKHKYHCPGLWANTCCSHPRPEEDIDDAIHRRLEEEMGFDAELKEVMRFIYKIKFDNGLTENEYLYVFKGKADPEITINKEEVEDHRWISIKDLKKKISNLIQINMLIGLS
jgi:isopentenyl-diphosphate delta-isomerase